MTTTAPRGSRSTDLATPDLFGRDGEVSTVRRLLASHRLVTVTGPGGVGKTRLAHAVLDDPATADAAVCALAPVPDSGGVATAVAEALGFPSLHAATVGLAGRRRLLLLDNAEHHLDAVAGAVSELAAGLPHLTVLVTSQEALDVPGERVVVLTPLPVPTVDDALDVSSSPAVQLFLARALAAGAELPTDPATAAAVAAICRRLDGLPLAIELAAARARTLSPADLLAHLDARFELLTRRRDRGPARHRSLEAAIDWSVERLDPATQRFLARLGAFCGPFSLAAAHAVAAGPGDTVPESIVRVDTLVHRSLLSVAHREGTASAYVLPESVRLYARRRLEEAGEDARCDERCVDHYVEIARTLVAEAQRSWSVEVLRTLVSAQLNLQDAARWCLADDDDPDRAFTLYVPLWGLVHNGRAEPIRDLGERLLARWPSPDQAGWAPVAATTATAALVTGQLERAGELASRVLAAGEGGVGAVIAARVASLAAVHAGDHAAATAYLDEASAAAEDDGLEPFAVELEVFRALAHARGGDLPAAAAAAAHARTRADAGDSDILRVFARLAAGSVAAAGDLGDPVPPLREAVALAEQGGYPWGIGTGHRTLGAVALVAGDQAGARHHLERSLETFVAVGQLGEAAGTLRWIGALLAVSGPPGSAARVLPGGPVVHPMVDVLERAHLDGLLAGVEPAGRGDDLRPSLAAARAALAAPPGPAADGTDRGTATPAPPDAQWIHEGAVWALTFAGVTVRLPDAKGLADLAVLLSRPGREVAATELAGGAVDSADLGPVIDVTARRAYERRIVELQEDLDEADSFGDLARADRARAELDQLVDALTAATGAGGRARRTGGSAERARSAVTRRIRDVLRRITDLHPPLGDHLTTAVRTGGWCAYDPAEPVEWTVAEVGQSP